MITLMSVLWASETPTKVEFPCSIHVTVVRLTGQMYVWGKRMNCHYPLCVHAQQGVAIVIGQSVGADNFYQAVCQSVSGRK